MRTTVILKDEVLKQAAEMTGIKEKTALIHAGLQALIEKKARERLIDAQLSALLDHGTVLAHPFVIEELACGYLPQRNEFLIMMHQLPQAPLSSHHEVLNFIANNKLYGTGLGSVDVHIIASAMLAKATIWSRDKALSREAARFGLAP